jgi:acyl-CoA synthetase (AMP-forming)/AMP-acid ligase II
MEIVTAANSERAQRRAAGSLLARGLGPGDRVAVTLPGSGAVLALVLGALRAGIVPVPLDPALTPFERGELIADAEPALVVDDGRLLAGLLDGPETDLAPVPLARPLHYTSGTTGRRKGVWSGVLGEQAGSALVAEEQELWGFTPTDRHLVLSSLHHSAPLRFAAGTLLAGGEVILPGPFAVPAVLAAIAETRPTAMFCVPAHLQRLFAAADAGGGLPPLGTFRLVAHAGAPCPPPLKRRLIDTFPPGSLWEFYGSTEGQFTACPAEEWLEHPGTVGRARPGRELAVDADGTIWGAMPPHARFTYWRDPAKTARAWRERDGRQELTVGDLGRLDGDGYLYLEGRREDLVITGGVNVYPAEVERVLLGCPGVDEVAVFGVPDERWGQRVCAAVVGTAPAREVADWARERLAPAKRPKEVYLVSELPRTATGKVRRRDLVELAGAPAGDRT